MYFLLKLLPYLLIAAIGASIGSFYQTLGDRILDLFYGQGRKSVDESGRHFTLSLTERYRQLFFAPSSCVSCKTRITPMYLIPILGWLLTKGCCSNCGSSIRISHLVMEALFAAVAVGFLFLTKNAVITLVLLFLCGHLLVSIKTDWHRQLLDYENTAVLFLLSILYVYFSGGDFLYHFYSFLGVGAFFLLVFLLTKGRQPGFGDILLASVLGFVHGFPWVLVPLQIGAAGSILHLWIIKRNFRSSAPLGFYLSIGSVFTLIASLIVN